MIVGVTTAQDGSFQYAINTGHEFFPTDIPPGTHVIRAGVPGSLPLAEAWFTVT
jgi:hypothetical protein